MQADIDELDKAKQTAVAALAHAQEKEGALRSEIAPPAEDRAAPGATATTAVNLP